MLNGCKIRLSWGKTGSGFPYILNDMTYPGAADKSTRSQEAQLRTLAALQGLNSMSPEYIERLNFALELVNNEPLFRQV